MNIQIIYRIFYKNIEEYNSDRECNVLIVFDDMIADRISNKRLNKIVGAEN